MVFKSTAVISDRTSTFLTAACFSPTRSSSRSSNAKQIQTSNDDIVREFFKTQGLLSEVFTWILRNWYKVTIWASYLKMNFYLFHSEMVQAALWAIYYKMVVILHSWGILSS